MKFGNTSERTRIVLIPFHGNEKGVSLSHTIFAPMTEVSSVVEDCLNSNFGNEKSKSKRKVVHK